MNMRQSRLMRTGIILTAVLFFITAAGCGDSQWVKKGTSLFQKKKELAPRYLDFEDILIPGELEVDKKSVYQSPGFSGGVLTLKGRVDMISLVTFFTANMPKDSWIVVSEFKSPRTKLLFQKDRKRCVISISEGILKTEVEVWVAPTTEEGVPDNGLLR